MFGSKGSGRFRWTTVVLVINILGIILSEYAVEGRAENENSLVGHNRINDDNGYKLADGSIAKHRVKRATLKNCREIIIGVGTEMIGGKEEMKQVQIQWEKDGDNVKFQVAAHVAEDEYIGLGWSAENETVMAGADAVISYIKNGKPNAVDHYLATRVQCSDTVGAGACRDTVIKGTNDVTDVSGGRENGHTVVRFTRPIKATNDKTDLSLETERTFFIAIGPLTGDLVLIHTERSAPPAQEKMNVMGPDSDTCILKEKFKERQIGLERPVTPWEAESITNVNVFHATIGPPGTPKGYDHISGLGVAWGDAWYLNNLLIPRIHVVRGRTYTFHVNGGPTHPLYITSSRRGGRFQDEKEIQQTEILFESGPSKEGVVGPSYCHWVDKNDDDSIDKRKESVALSKSVKEYVSTLKVKCNPPVNEASKKNILTWKVATSTPNVVYYQCYKHKLLGFQIHVHNEGEAQVPHVVPPVDDVNQLGPTGPTSRADKPMIAKISGNFIFLVSTSVIVTISGNTIFNDNQM